MTRAVFSLTVWYLDEVAGLSSHTILHLGVVSRKVVTPLQKVKGYQSQHEM